MADVFPLDALEGIFEEFQQDLNHDNSHLKFGLYGNDLTPDINTVKGSLTPASFAGYAVQGITGAGTLDDDGAQHGRFTLNALTWTATGPTPGAQVYGWYAYDDRTNRLRGVQRWPNAPLDMSFAGAFATLVPRWIDGQFVVPGS